MPLRTLLRVRVTHARSGNQVCQDHLSPINHGSNLLIAPSILAFYVRSLKEMTPCARWRIQLLVLICSLLRFSCAALAPPQALLGLQTQQTSHDQLGAVASENRVCSQIGIDLLKAGGNAADAVGVKVSFPRAQLTVGQLVGTTLCIGVVGQ